MNKPTVTQAQTQRLVTALEKMGKTVFGVRAHPDGSVDVLLTEPPPAPQIADGTGTLEALARKHGYD